MRISGNGNVGIGTTSPSQILHLYKSSGTILAALQTGTSYGYFYNDGTNIGLASDQGSSGYKLIVNRSAPDNSMSISSTGAATFSSTVNAIAFNGTNNTSFAVFYNNASTFVGGLGTYAWQVGGTNYTDLSLVANANLGIFTNNSSSPAIYINTSKNVGIGTTSPQTLLSVETSGVQSTVSPIITSQSSGVTYTGLYSIRDGAGDQRGLIFQVYTANVGLNEKMRITSGGNIGIGNTGNSGIRVNITGATSDSSTQAINVSKADGTNLFYARNDGYLYSVGAWSGSDRRLKENIADLENGLEIVLGLKAKKFDLINGLKNNYGFIAQEMQEIIPDAVSVFEEKEQLLAVRMDYIIPHLVKAIQEQQAQIEELKAKIK
jgi:hypothetical protein